MNERSSRSHCIFRIIIESRAKLGEGLVDSSNSASNAAGEVSIGVLNLVDLAGSESVRTTNAVGERLKESKMINTSLLTLSRIIKDLAESGKSLAYRQSKLTRVLQPSLAGNTKLTVICCVNPNSLYLEESKATLEFAVAAKGIRMQAERNTVVDEAARMKALEKELLAVKEQLKQLQQASTEDQYSGDASEDSVGNTSILNLDLQMPQELHGKTTSELIAHYERKLAQMGSVMLVGGTKQKEVSATGLGELARYRSVRAQEHQSALGRSRRHRETWCPAAGAGGGEIRMSFLADLRSAALNENKTDLLPRIPSDIGKAQNDLLPHSPSDEVLLGENETNPTALGTIDMGNLSTNVMSPSLDTSDGMLDIYNNKSPPLLSSIRRVTFSQDALRATMPTDSDDGSDCEEPQAKAAKYSHLEETAEASLPSATLTNNVFEELLDVRLRKDALEDALSKRDAALEELRAEHVLVLERARVLEQSLEQASNEISNLQTIVHNQRQAETPHLLATEECNTASELQLELAEALEALRVAKEEAETSMSLQAQLEAQLKQAIQEKEDTLEQSTIMAQQLEEAGNQLLELSSLLETVNTEYSQNRAKEEELRAALASMESRYKTEEAIRLGTEKTLEKSMQELTEKSMQLSIVEKDHTELTSQLALRDKEISSHLASLSSLHAITSERDILQAEVKNSTAQLERLTTENTNLMLRLNEILAENARLEAILKQDAQFREAEAAEEASASADSDSRDGGVALDDVSNNSNAASNEFQAKFREMEEQYLLIQQEKVMLSESMSKLREDYFNAMEKRSEEMAELQKLLIRTETEHKDASEKVAALHKETVDGLEQRLREFENANMELTNAHEKLIQESTVQKQVVDELQSTLDATRSHVEEIEASLRKSETAAAHLLKFVQIAMDWFAVHLQRALNARTSSVDDSQSVVSASVLSANLSGVADWVGGACEEFYALVDAAKGMEGIDAQVANIISALAGGIDDTVLCLLTAGECVEKLLADATEKDMKLSDLQQKLRETTERFDSTKAALESLRATTTENASAALAAVLEQQANLESQLQTVQSSNSQLTSRISALEAEKSTMAEEMVALQNTRTANEATTINLRLQLESLEEKNNELRSEIASTIAECQSHTSAVNIASSRVNRLESLLQEKTDELQVVLSKLDSTSSLEKELQSAKGEIEQLRLVLSITEEAKISAEKELVAVHEEMHTLKFTASTYEADLRTKDSELLSLQGTVGTLKKENDTLTATVKDLHSVSRLLETTERELQSALARINLLEAEKQTNESASVISVGNTSTAVNLANAIAVRDSLAAENAELQLQISDLSSKFVEIKDAYESVCNTLISEREAWKTHSDSLTREIQEMENHALLKQKEFEALQQTLTSIKDKVNVHEAAVTDKENARQALSERLSRAQLEVTSLNASLERYIAQLDAARAENAALHAKISEMETKALTTKSWDNEILQFELKQAQQLTKQYESELITLRRDLSAAQTNLAVTKQESTQWKQRFEEQLAKLETNNLDLANEVSLREQKEKDYAQVCRELDSIREKYTEAESTLIVKNAQLSSAVSRAETVSNHLLQAEEAIGRLNARIERLEKAKLTEAQVKKMMAIKREYDTLKLRVAELNAEKQKLQEQLGATLASRSTDSAAVESLTAQYAKSEEMVSQLKKQVSSLELSLEESKGVIEDTRNSLQDAIEEISQLTASRIELSKQLKRHESLVEMFQSFLAMLQAHTLHSVTQLKDRKVDVALFESTVDLVEDDESIVAQKLQTLESFVVTLHSAFIDLEKSEKNVKLAAELADKKSALVINTLRDDVQAMQNEMEDLLKDMKTLEASNIEKDATISSTKRALHDAEHNATQAASRSEILERNCEKLSNMVESMKKELADAAKEHTQSISFLEKENLALMQELRSLRTQLVTAPAHLAAAALQSNGAMSVSGRMSFAPGAMHPRMSVMPRPSTARDAGVRVSLAPGVGRSFFAPSQSQRSSIVSLDEQAPMSRDSSILSSQGMHSMSIMRRSILPNMRPSVTPLQALQGNAQNPRESIASATSDITSNQDTKTIHAQPGSQTTGSIAIQTIEEVSTQERETIVTRNDFNSTIDSEKPMEEEMQHDQKATSVSSTPAREKMVAADGFGDQAPRTPDPVQMNEAENNVPTGKKANAPLVLTQSPILPATGISEAPPECATQ